MITFKKTLMGAATIAAFGFFTAPATLADAQINFGNTWLGVNDEGHLNVVDDEGVTSNAGGFTGLTFVGAFGNDGSPDGRDATAPGCLCEGWGVSVNGTESMSASEDSGGVNNLTLDSFSSTASTATSVVSMTSLPGLTVTHAYQPSAAANVFEAIVTIANGTGADVTDVRYTRAMDWDIPPTEFDELVTIGGTATTTNLLYSSDDGFADPDPLATRFGMLAECGVPVTTDFTDCGPDDHGALFDFGFGNLAAGESLMFSIFYGAAATEAAATAALGTIGAELFSFGQQSGPDGGIAGAPATFLFAFSGVGGEVVVPPTPAPAPATLLLLGLGLAGLRFRLRSA